jgi:gliding motility-associated-like protein
MTVNPLPIAVLSVSPSLSFISGTEITFTASGGTEYAFYVNSSVVQSRSTTDTYITDTLEDGDVITVYVYDGNSCMSYTSTTVTVYDGIVAYDVLYTASEYCEGDGGVSIYLGDTPQYGVTYELLRTSDDGQEGSSIMYDGTNTVRWDNVAGTEEYRIEAYYSAVPDEIVEMNNRVTVTENTLPTVYDISPTGTVTGCNDGAGHVISVDGSESGVTYSLLLEGTEVETMAGTGSSIDFSAQLGVGTYTVTAEDDATGCSSDMNGTFEIEDDGSNVAFTVYAVDPALENDSTDGRYCEDESGVEIALDGSLDTGVTYKLYLDGTDTGISVVGDGGTLSFGTLVAEGTYTVRVESSTGCEFLMDGYVDVSIISLPTAFNVEVDNSGHYCQDDTGVYISIDDQEEDVMYILYLDGTTAVDTITGTDASGTSLYFDGPITTEGTYSVEAQVIEVGCSSSMSNSVIVTMDDLPVAYDVTTDPGYYCTGSTTSITLSDSESDVDYSLYMVSSTLVETISGTGASLSFEVDTQGSYYVVGIRNDGVTGCSNVMNDTVSITEVDLPDDKYLSTAYYGSGCDDGDSIVVLQTQEFVTYELVKVVSGSYYSVDIDSIYGDGTDQGFEKIVDTNDAVYTVLATNSFGCSIYLNDSVYVNVPNVVEKQVVTGEGEICNGDSGVEFGLEDTETGVEYQLWRDGDTDYKESITGDGGAMTFTEVNEEGTYYVLGITTDCSLEMANRVTLTFYDLPIAYAMTGSGLSCDLSNDGAYVGLEATEEDVTYTLQYDDGSGVLDNIDETIGDASGDAIEWKVTEEGTYTVIAETLYGCTSSMNGSVYVMEGSTPTDYDVFADSYTYCEGDEGIELFIENNEIDVVYYIINTSTNDTISVDGVNSDTSVADTISLGVYTAGTYDVVGVLGGDACETAMNGGISITIDESTSPQSFELLVLDATVCGSDSAVVYLDGYEVDREYRIEDSTGAILDTITSTDRDSIYWYVSDVSGSEIYEVIAISGGTCDLSMGTVEVTYSDGPDDFTISLSDTVYCEGSDSISVSIDLTESDVAYLLVESDDVSTALDVLIGNDASQTFTKQIGEGSYLVRAILYSTGCETISEDTINITKSALPEILADIYCGYVGNSDCTVGDSICIDPSEEDIIYYLYDSDGVVKIDSVYADSGSLVCFDSVDNEGEGYIILAQSLNYPYCQNYFDTSFDYSYSDYGSLVAVDDVFNVASGLTIDTCYSRANDTLVYVYNSIEYVVPYDDLGNDTYFDTNSDEVTVIDKYYGDYETSGSANIEFHLINNDDGTEVLTYANDTVGTFVMDQDYGSIVYTKTPGFYGKYTLYYVIENTEYEDRRDTASVSLYVGNSTVDDETSFLIPNAFSPNDDGINDYYVISGEEGGITATSSTLEVYNRWGTLVYRSDGTLYGEGDDWWDGTSTTSNMVSIGSDLPNGTYFYIFKVEINDEGTIKSKDYNGYIELRR